MCRSLLLCVTVFAAICSVLPGCSDGGVKYYPVKGKVLYKSAPAAGATVVFHPKDNDKIDAIRPSAVVGEDGSYTLSCPGPIPGAPDGEYEVVVVWDQAVADATKGKKALKMGGGEAKETKDKLAGQYANPKTSGLRATVKPESNEIPPFDLK